MGTALGAGNWKWLGLGFVFGLLCAYGGVAYLTWGSSAADAESRPESNGDDPHTVARVRVVHPEKGKMPRYTRQAGTVMSFDSVKLFAEVSGYVKEEAVDIGDKVKRGDVLIKIDVPELEKLRDKWKAMIAQSDARVKQADRKSVV